MKILLTIISHYQPSLANGFSMVYIAIYKSRQSRVPSTRCVAGHCPGQFERRDLQHRCPAGAGGRGCLFGRKNDGNPRRKAG